MIGPQTTSIDSTPLTYRELLYRKELNRPKGPIKSYDVEVASGKTVTVYTDSEAAAIAFARIG